ncbi:MAG: flagellar hook protein FlgE [Gammaproteobacteria bacterium]|nr:flagellar hook protein FlgE [Gammaproteobacteria bacterium]
MPFRIALSGLHSSATDLKVTGNNIANAATTGFKQSRAEFVDVYASAYGGISAVTNGSGVRTSNIRQLFSQGNIEYTDNSTDIAITGQGFFIVNDDKGRYLSRNGTFGLNRDGDVVNSTGQKLQVFPPVVTGAGGASNTLFNTGSLQSVTLSNTIGAPIATTSVDVNVNLDGNITNADYIPLGTAGAYYEHGTGVTPFDPNDPTTFHHVTATTVYDSLGGDHTAQLYYRKISNPDPLPAPGVDPIVNDLWQVVTYIDGQEVPPTNNGLPPPAVVPPAVSVAGTAGNAALLQFNNDGTLLDTSTVGDPASVSKSVVYDLFRPSTGAADVQITIDFGATTQYGDDFAVNELSQDGFTTGRLTGFDVAKNGVVFARYTNGNAEVLGMVALANVPNPQGLNQKGDSLWSESFDAGDTVLGQPGTASLGLLQSGALEASTVEIADQLVNMIISQRNYQANAQVISTADQLTQTLLNIR